MRLGTWHVTGGWFAREPPDLSSSVPWPSAGFINRITQTPYDLN